MDAAVAALTVPDAHRLVDFTQPFYSTGLGIAVTRDAGVTWWPIISDVFSLRFLLAVAALFAISVVVGLVLGGDLSAATTSISAPIDEAWVQASGGPAVAMTQSGSAAGEKVPVTLLGRLIAIVWMVASVIVIASFTAALTSRSSP